METAEVDALADTVEAVRTRLLDRPRVVWCVLHVYLVNDLPDCGLSVLSDEKEARELALRVAAADYTDAANYAQEVRDFHAGARTLNFGESYLSVVPRTIDGGWV